MASTTSAPSSAERPAASRDLRRSIGFWGLTFISLGSIIGSGWLLGALDRRAVGRAGLAHLVDPRRVMLLAVLALIHAELGATYPVAGGTARFPYFAFGTLAGFTAGWAAYLQAVTIAPIEVEASISYLNSTQWAHEHLNMLHKNGTLNGTGFVVATLAMLLFTAINLLGAKLLSDSNTLLVIWKAAVPILAVVVIMSLSFHPSNFSAGGGFAPYGAHGIFAALPLGVVFALQGFEQAVQMGGEARNPQRDLSRAIIAAMSIGAAVYIALEIAFIGGLSPQEPDPRLGAPDRRRRLRPVLHARPGRRRRLAGHHPAHRRGDLARRHRPHLSRPRPLGCPMPSARKRCCPTS